MREMTKTERKEIEFKVSEIMRSAVSSEYSRYILEQEDDVTGNTFMEDVIKNVMEIFAMEDYVEDTLEVKLVLSEVGHPVSQ